MSLSGACMLYLGMVDPGGELLGRESAEDERVNSADASTRQHCDDRFRYHRHVDEDAVALDDPTWLQNGRELWHLQWRNTCRPYHWQTSALSVQFRRYLTPRLLFDRDSGLSESTDFKISGLILARIYSHNWSAQHIWLYFYRERSTPRVPFADGWPQWCKKKRHEVTDIICSYVNKQ